MKIVKANAGSLTNFEVLDFLNSRGASKYTTRVIAPIARSEYKMVIPIVVEDMKREFQILKALSGHENVVQFHNAFEDEDFVYIVMELWEGREFRNRLLSKIYSR